MATTTNYAWTTPDNSGLVKNGAQDIRTLGSSVDTALWNVGFGQAGKNKIINGDTSIWARGTSTTMSNNTHAFGPDRFRAYVTFSAGTTTFAQQSFTPGAAPVAGYESPFFARLTCGSTSTYAEISQKIEDVRTFAGQTATLSFWAKSSAALTFVPYLIQQFGSGGSGDVATAGSGITLTSSWVRYTTTLAVPSISGKTIGTGSSLLALFAHASGSLNSATIDIWGVQVEYGSTATPFETASGTIQGEIALCQRYYWQQATGTTQTLALAAYQSSTQPIGWIQYPVTMRATPTLSYVSGTNFYAIDITNSAFTFNDVSNSLASNVGSRIFASTGSSTAGFTGIIRTNNAAAAVGWSAEL